MKKWIALLLALAMVLSLGACGKKGSPDPSQNPENEENPLSFTFTQFGNAKITIVGTEFAVDEYGDDFLRVYYDYTNTGDSVAEQYTAVAVHYGKITQNGNELFTTIFSDFDEAHVPEDLTGNTSVMPGCTLRCTTLIPCSPDDGTVTIPYYVMIGSHVFDESKVEYFTLEVDPKNTMGAPDSPYVYPAISNPSYTAGWATAGSIDNPIDCDVSIDDWEITSDYEGRNILRVFLTYTNNSEVELAPMSMAYADVFQDGISLSTVSSWDLPEPLYEDALYQEDLYPGETVQCSALFLLRSRSPVEVVIEPMDCDTRLGMRCDVAGQIVDTPEAPGSAQVPKALVGYWIRTDGWEDTLLIEADGTGVHNLTGDDFPFQFTLEGNQIFLHYDDGDEAEFIFEILGDQLFLTDDFDSQQTFSRDGGSVQTPAELDADALLGYWLDVEAGENESFTFKKDGTGLYTYQSDSFTLTYEIDGEFIHIYFSDGDYSGFYWLVEGDVLNLYGNGTDWYLERQN